MQRERWKERERWDERDLIQNKPCLPNFQIISTGITLSTISSSNRCQVAPNALLHVSVKQVAYWVWHHRRVVRKQAAEHCVYNWMNQLVLSWNTRVRAPSWHFRWWVGYLEKKSFSESLSRSSLPFHLVPVSNNKCEWPRGTAVVSCSQLQQAYNIKENDSATVWFVARGAKLWQTARELPPSHCLTEVSSSCCCFLKTHTDVWGCLQLLLLKGTDVCNAR